METQLKSPGEWLEYFSDDEIDVIDQVWQRVYPELHDAYRQQYGDPRSSVIVFAEERPEEFGLMMAEYGMQTRRLIMSEDEIRQAGSVRVTNLPSASTRERRTTRLGSSAYQGISGYD